MRILIVSATEFERDFLRQKLSTTDIDVSFFTHGVGLISTTFHLTERLGMEKSKYEWIIQIGIAGTFQPEKYPINSLVAVSEEHISQFGVTENKQFKDIFDLGLIAPYASPFTNKKLINPYITDIKMLNLPKIKGLSVQDVSAKKSRINFLKTYYNPDIETMEGACFHYVCLMKKIKFLQLRSISNFVGERDKKKWNIEKGLHALAVYLNEFLPALKLYK